jgi:hypothetical protein
MDYGKIVATGWKQAWKHPTLWIFGFFISGGGFNYAGDIGDKVKFKKRFDLDLGSFPRIDGSDVRNFLESNLPLILFLVAMGLLALLIFIVLSNISIGGLINAARQMKRGQTYSFIEAFKAGAHYFWRIFGLSILLIILIFALLIMLFIFGFVAFKIHVAIGVLSLLILIPVLIIAIFVITITWAMANRYIVAEDKFVFDAIGDGFTLWKSNLGPSVIYSLIYIAIGIGVLIGTFIIAASVILPFIGVAFVNVLLAVLVGAPVVLMVLLVIDGLTGSAMHLMTTEFFFQLREGGMPSAATPTTPTEPPLPPPPPPPVTENG